MSDVDELEMELEAENNDEWDDARFQRRMDHVAHASSNIGTLLFKGWTMLADECQKCHTPLMSLHGGTPICVACNPVQDNTPNTIQIAKNPQKSQKKQSTLNDIDELQELNALNNKLNNQQFEKRMQKSEDASRKVGELLLKGWTMLAQHCDHCSATLVSLRGGDPMCCVCDGVKQNKNVAIVQGTKLFKEKKEIKAKQEEAYRHNSYNIGNDDNLVPQRREIRNGNAIAFEQKRNDEHYNYGFGARQDDELSRTLGGIVQTVLDKMSVINDRMSRNSNRLQNDINELNDLMAFLLNVKKFKNQLRRVD